VKTFLRLVAASGLAGLLLAPPGFAESQLPEPLSSTGAYLAGQQALQELRTPDAARFLHDAAVDGWDNPTVLDRAYLAYAADGDIDSAVTAAQHLLTLEPDNQLAKIVVATEAIKQRRYDAALRALDKMGEDSFEGITGAVLRAWAIAGTGNFDAAFKALDRIGNGGLEEFLVFHRALMADLAGRQSDAVKLATEALDSDPYTVPVLETYARVLANAGQFDKALDAIVQFEAQGLSHPAISALKLQLIAKQRPVHYVDSVQAGGAELFHSLGVAFARQGSNDIGLVLLRLAGYLNPRNMNVPFVIGQLYDGAGQHDLANAVYESVPETSPMRPMAVVRLASNLDAMGNRAEAIRRLGNIVVSDPQNLDAVQTLADLQRADKQYAAAIENYTRVLAITGGKAPADWQYYYMRGIAYERSNQLPLAETDFKQALVLNPDQPSVLNYLGYTWVDKGMHLTEALAMIQKAVAGSPNDGYIIDSLGWAYFRLGRFDDAVTELERAVKLKPNDPEINDHLGDAYWRVGRKLEATFQWNIATSVDTEGNVKARVAPKLRNGLDDAPPPSDSAPVDASSSSAPASN